MFGKNSSNGSLENVKFSMSKVASVDKQIKIPADSVAPDKTGMCDIGSVELAKEMVPGWNVGNSFEAIGGETAWGNPKITQLLIDSIKAAGFNAVRIPVAWSKFSDASISTIDASWLDRVEEVVNYVLSDGMYAIINEHWDNGSIGNNAFGIFDRLTGVKAYPDIVTAIIEASDTSNVTGLLNIDRLPTKFSLMQNYPNPFNPSTVISYQLPKSSYVSLKIFDVLGREIATLVNQFQQAGNYNSHFSLLNSQLSSGVYFYALSAGNFIQTKKMILAK
jgi:hypothetical protein